MLNLLAFLSKPWAARSNVTEVLCGLSMVEMDAFLPFDRNSQRINFSPGKAFIDLRNNRGQLIS